MTAPEYYQIKIPLGLVQIEDGHVVLQPWHVSYALGQSYTRGAIIKYGCRAGRKPGASEKVDLLKVRASVDERLAEIEIEEAATSARVAKVLKPKPKKGKP
jgi:hypothetical protein